MSKRRKAQAYIEQAHTAFINEQAKNYPPNGKIATTKYIRPVNVHQKQFTKSIKQNILTIGVGEAGTGKLNPNDTQVLTPQGYVRLDSLKINDYVVSVKGVPTKVLNIYPKQDLEIYELEFSDGTFTKCCIDHLWAVRTPKETETNSSYKVKSLKDLLPKIQERKFKSKKTHYYEIPITNPVEFEKQELLIDPYILGCLLGDGHFNQSGAFNFTVGQQDLHFFEEVFKEYTTHKAFYNGVYKLSSSLISSEIRALELNGKTKHGKFIPKEYLYSTIEDRLALLQGLMDTDGSINFKGNKIRFSNNNINLVEGVVHIVQTLGGTASISSYQRKDRDIEYTVFISLPNTIKCFKLPRKNKQNRQLEIRRKIVSAKYIGRQDGRCIYIEDDSHLFLLNDCIVTHNTVLALHTGIELVNNSESPIQKIIYVRANIEDREEKDLGAMPGELADKTKFLAYPVMDNLETFMTKESVEYTLEHSKIEVLPLMMMRGRSFHNTFVILDESQNATKKQLKTLMTRLCEDSKLVIIGDPTQCDIEPFKNGLIDLQWRLVKKRNEDLTEDNQYQAQINYGVIEFDYDDILRSELTKFAIDLYNIV